METSIVGLAGAAGAIAAAIVLVIVALSNARRDRARDMERAKDREEAAAIRATDRDTLLKDREEAAIIRAADRAAAAEDRKLMLAKSEVGLQATIANSKKSDEIINGVAKVHELTNSTNSELQKTVAVLTERFAGSEKMVTQLLQQIKDVAANKATADVQIAAAMATTPIVSIPRAPAESKVNDKVVDLIKSNDKVLDAIQTNTQETATNTKK